MGVQPLQVRPLKELTLSPVDRAYRRRVYWYLENVLKCKVTLLGELEGHMVEFPEGTVEEVYAGKSTQFSYRTTIRFKDGRTLTKYVNVSLPDMRPLTILGFPVEVLEEPKTPTK